MDDKDFELSFLLFWNSTHGWVWSDCGTYEVHAIKFFLAGWEAAKKEKDNE